MCRPTLIEPTAESTRETKLEILGLRNPLFMHQVTYVSNNVCLGGDTARTLLITGPNMGGKSTLLRATALAVVLA